jgi:hypothetical protein
MSVSAHVHAGLERRRYHGGQLYVFPLGHGVEMLLDCKELAVGCWRNLMVQNLRQGCSFHDTPPLPTPTPGEGTPMSSGE